MTHVQHRMNDLSPESKRALLAELMAKKGQTAGPLSYGQQALWFLWNLAPNSAAYNVLQAFHVASNVSSAEALQQAIDGLVERHAVLRTTYPSVDGLPVRKVHSSRNVMLERIDAAGWSDESLRLRVSADGDRPFDLQQGPVLRAVLYSRSAREHVLALTIHHIAFDDLSNRSLMRDFAELYEAAHTGGVPPQPSTTASFDDYVRWQAQILAGPEGDRLWRYWRQQLAGELVPLHLPTDRPRPALQTFDGASFSFVLSGKLAEGIARLARGHETTPFVVTAAIFAALLHRLTGQDDVLIGTPTAGRSRPEFSEVVGYFVNPVILRSDVKDDPTFSDHLSRVRQTVLDALDHGDFPFPLLVERLQPVRDPSFSPLYQVGFVWDKVVRNETGFSTLAATPWMAGQRGANADLGLTIFQDGNTLTGSWQFNTDLFDEDTVRRVHGSFETLILAAIEAPSLRISELAVLTASERHRVLVEWNDTAAPGTESLLHQLIERQVECDPDAVAVTFDDYALTYSELNGRANQLARALRSRGVGPEVRVGIAMERSLDMVVSLLAVLKAGGAYAPLDPEYPRERLAYMLEDSGVAVLLTHSGVLPVLGDVSIPVIALDVSGTALSHESVANLDLRFSADHLAYVIYTSGSTGRPKGAMNSHRGIVNRLRWMQDQYGLTSSDCVLQKTPFGFDVSVWEFFWPLLTGARMVVARPGGHRDPRYLAKTILTAGITTIHFVPSMLQAFIDFHDDLHADCATLKRVICSGEALSAALAQRCLRMVPAELHNLYGPTEAAVDVTHHACHPRNVGDAGIPIGRPVANTQMYVLDRALRPVPPGVEGELCIGGVQVGRGYLGRPSLTGERFVPDPFSVSPGSRLYRTGDRARHRRDGAIEFLGRFDDQVKVRGFRIELGEIEAALLRLPAVAAAAVIVRDQSSEDKQLVAYLVARGTKPTVEDVRRSLLESLPEFMVPPLIVFLDALPMTSSGKLDRRALPEPALHDQRSSFVAPRTETEELVCRIWSDVLRVDRIGVTDNFFELGGHSLLATKVMSRLRAATGADLPLRAFFEHTTPEGLAVAVVQQQAGLVHEDTLAKLLAEIE